MTLNRNEYDYIVSDLHPHILWEVKKPGTVDQTIYRENIKDLTLRLAKRQPEWRFVIGENFSGNGVRLMSNVRVYQEDERLGSYWYSYRYSGHGAEVRIDCRSLAARRKRGSSTGTTDANKAVRLIEANFARMSRRELAASRMTSAQAALGSQHHTLRREFQASREVMASVSISYVLNHYDYIKEHIPTLSEEDVAKYKTYKANYYAVQSVLNVLDNKQTGVVVVTSGSDYVCCVPPASAYREPVVYTHDTLPVDYRAKLGMLKLVNIGDIVPDVGARSAPDTYILINV